MIGDLVVWVWFSLRSPSATPIQNTDHLESRLVKTPEEACRILREVGTGRMVYRVVDDTASHLEAAVRLEPVELVCAKGAK